MYPIGVNGSKLVSDILKDAKTPLRLKANQYVLVDDEKVLALVGHCVSSIEDAEQYQKWDHVLK